MNEKFSLKTTILFLRENFVFMQTQQQQKKWNRYYGFRGITTQNYSNKTQWKNQKEKMKILKY